MPHRVSLSYLRARLAAARASNCADEAAAPTTEARAFALGHRLALNEIEGWLELARHTPARGTRIGERER